MTADRRELPRTLSLFDAIAITVGSMIGSGIFLKPAAIAKLLPDPMLVLLVWFVTGLLSLFGALTYAELGACYPRSGGLYAFLYEAYGPFIAYLFGWSVLAILQTGSIAGIAAGVSQVVCDLMQAPQYRMALAAWLIALISAMHMLSVRAGAAFQNVFTVAKTGGILFLVLAGLGSESNPQHLQTAGAVPAGMMLVSAFGVAMVKALWAYDGWVNVTFTAGEVLEPQRNLPRALAFGTGIVFAVYGLANIAYHAILPLQVVQQTPNVASHLAEKLFGPAGLMGMGILVIVSTLGALNSSVLSGPRVYFGVAQDGQLPPLFGEVHPQAQTPYMAIAIQAVWSMALLWVWGTFEAITDNVVFIFWIFYALGAGAVIILRLRHPHQVGEPRERPYRTAGYPIVPIVFILSAIFLVVNNVFASPRESLQALALLGIGGILYPLLRQKEGS